MKKLALLVGLVAFTITAFAQSKGEMYIAPSISASFGRQYASYFDFTTHYEASRPLDVSVSPYCEYGFFPADNWRIAFALGFPFYATPETEYNNGWDYSYAMAMTFSPNVAYYVRLADKFYYTPEIGVMVEFGRESVDFKGIFDRTTPAYYGVYCYANLLGFEYRVSEKIAIGVGISSIYYLFAREFGSQYRSSQWRFSFNNSTVSVLFYL